MASFSFKNKTVVLMIKVAELGGAERQALGLAKYLIDECKCQVIIVATHSNNQTVEFKTFAASCGIFDIHYFGVPSLTVRKKISYSNIKKIIRAFKYIALMKKEVSKFKPNIIIPFLNTPSKIAALIYKSTGASFTFWHQLGLDTYMMDELEKKAITKVPFIVSNSENGLEVFKTHYKVTNKKLFVLPHYVSISKIKKDKNTLKKVFKIKSGAIVIGMIAHFRKEKYQTLLLDAFLKLSKAKNIHLILMGNKDNSPETLRRYNELQNIIIKNKIEDQITLVSGIEVENILNIMDIGVLVSEVEGTPTVVMEYMLYGMPVVATNHLGCKTLLKDSAFLIENDESLLIEKLNILIENKALRDQEGKLNAERIKSFSISSYVEKLTTIINTFN